jgi:chromosome segregation ATPase
MKIYKKFSSFIKEEVEVQDLENLESLENLEKQVMEYKSKKNILDKIYQTNINEKDLENKLFNSKLVIRGKDNKMAFTNELLEIWAKIAGKKKEIQNINDTIEGYKNNIIQKQDLIKKNSNLQESTNEEITELNKKISDKLNEINLLKMEITKIDTEIKNKLTLLNKKISNMKSKK